MCHHCKARSRVAAEAEAKELRVKLDRAALGM